ncbi:MAG: WD40/YVTN/BNR-like repeat-containing protein, partial [Thermoanaerobaculia bacterium]
AHLRLGAPALLLVIALIGLPISGAPQDDEIETSLLKPLASRSLLLDGAAAGGLMMAVGERGHVLLSRDNGESWTQVEVPTRSTLTGVFLHDEKLGWVVGHDAVILRTRDGGDSWERLFWAPEQERALFDVWFRDAENGFAIGAYGFFLETTDSGDSWTERPIVDPDTFEEEYDPYAFTSAADVHLNQVSDAGSGRLYVAAEAGMAFRSDDAGVTWVTLEPPYEGSFFGSLPLAGDSVLLFGLRGNLFRSDDAGATWQAVDTGTVALLTDGVRLADGPVVVTGLAGTLLISRDDGASFELAQQPDRQGLATALPTTGGGLVLIGEFGVSRVAPAALAP